MTARWIGEREHNDAITPCAAIHVSAYVRGLLVAMDDWLTLAYTSNSSVMQDYTLYFVYVQIRYRCYFVNLITDKVKLHGVFITPLLGVLCAVSLQEDVWCLSASCSVQNDIKALIQVMSTQ